MIPLPPVGEVLRFLGMSLSSPAADEERLRAEIAGQCAALQKRARPRFACEALPRTEAEALLGCRLPGRGGQVLFLAATLGHEADRAVQVLERTDAYAAAVLDACENAAFSAFLEQKLSEASPCLHRPGLFTPGSGDWPLERNGPVLTRLRADRTLGIYANRDGSLSPAKSLAGVLVAEAGPGGCAGCEKTDCPFRRPSP